MACENDKCEKYGMHHDYKNGVEVRKCQFCESDETATTRRKFMNDTTESYAKDYAYRKNPDGSYSLWSISKNSRAAFAPSKCVIDERRERSKREDHESGCGTLSTVETQ
jgi:hypothetical protein